MADQTPKTIEELKAFCANKGMPLEKMRFFIGEDYREARAFGIYRDEDGDFIVYKNKADGSRSVRYSGPDEAYAVKEIYEKLRSEVELRRNGGASTTAKKSEKNVIRSIVALFLVLMIGANISSCVADYKRPKGYYRYQNQTYYYDSSSWYIFNDALSTWSRWNAAANWTDAPRDYYLSQTYNDSYDVDDFRDSQYYHEDTSSSHSSSDSWSSYDYDSWDSGSTDWNSDW